MKRTAATKIKCASAWEKGHIVNFPKLRFWQHKILLTPRRIMKKETLEKIPIIDRDKKNLVSGMFRCVISRNSAVKFTLLELCHNLSGFQKWPLLVELEASTFQRCNQLKLRCCNIKLVSHNPAHLMICSGVAWLTLSGRISNTCRLTIWPFLRAPAHLVFLLNYLESFGMNVAS